MQESELAWRKSGGARRSLGCVPFKASGTAYAQSQTRYGKVWLSLWNSYILKHYHLGSGSIREDARGRWTINIRAPRRGRNWRYATSRLASI